MNRKLKVVLIILSVIMIIMGGFIIMKNTILKTNDTNNTKDKIDEDIMPIISEIKYDKNDVDDERFLFSMNDGNYVYITLSKMRKINNYGKIVESIKDQKGILYLDYGNYFVPKE